MKKDLAVHTRIPPDQRAKTLTKFVNAVNNNEEAHLEMGGWGLKFSESLIKIKGRVLDTEKIKQAGSSVSSVLPCMSIFNT